MKTKHLSAWALLQFLYESVQMAFFLAVGVFWLTGLLHLRDRYWQAVLVGMGALFVVAVVDAGLRYWCFTYQITATGLTIHEGIIFREVHHLPYRQIQAVQRQQRWFMRPLHLEQVTIATAERVDDEDGIKLPLVTQTVGDYLAQQHAIAVTMKDRPDEAVEAAAVDTKVEPVAATNATSPVIEVAWHDLNLYALSSIGIIPIVIALIWLVGEGSRWLNGHTWDMVSGLVAHFAPWEWGLLVVSVVILGLVASYLNVIQKYYHFTLAVTPANLTVTHGFFDRNQANIRRTKIQAVKFKQTLIRQWLHLMTVQVLSASQVGANDDDDQLLLLPVVPQNQALAVLQPVIDWLPGKLPLLTTLTGRAKFALIRNNVIAWFGVLAVLSGGLAWWQPVFLKWLFMSWPLWLAFASLQGWYAGHQMGAATLNADLLILRTGTWFRRQVWLVPRAKVQAVGVHQSIWMARTNLAHLNVSLRSGNGEELVEVRYLPAVTAQQIQAWYLAH